MFSHFLHPVFSSHLKITIRGFLSRFSRRHVVVIRFTMADSSYQLLKFQLSKSSAGVVSGRIFVEDRSCDTLSHTDQPIEREILWSFKASTTVQRQGRPRIGTRESNHKRERQSLELSRIAAV